MLFFGTRTTTSSYPNSATPRWLVIESEIRKQAAIKKITEQVEKKLKSAQASLRQLSGQEFACIADAKMAIKRLSEFWKYHQITKIESREKPAKKPTFKPKISSQTQTTVYQVTDKIESRESVIEAEKIKAGRFILATNILDTTAVSNQQVLSKYKAQQSNERGFRFIKDPLFFTSSVFVKNPERVICNKLSLYGSCQEGLRRCLKEILIQTSLSIGERCNN